MTGRYFEDFTLNETIEHATPRTITQGDAAHYIALTGARQVLHCADTIAKACGFGAMPLDQLLVFHIAFGKTVPDISINAVANLGYAEVLFHAPVYAGDTLSVHSDVIGLKENSNGKTGVVYVHSHALNQNGAEVLSWKRWVMVHKRNHHQATQHNTIPSYSLAVANDKLPVPAGFSVGNELVRATGSSKTAAQFKIGDVIAHGGGITIGDSDHMLATRLYQNNARVHFDGAFMQKQSMGKRLVYGGHIMSLCRALSYNGLENALWISAFHGGQHTNPSFAGDTIYSASVISDIAPLNNQLSAVRVCTFGLKQEPDDCYLGELPELVNAQKMPESVVLKWDYSVLMPS